MDQNTVPNTTMTKLFLYNPEDEATYEIVVSSADAERAERDPYFAQSILQGLIADERRRSSQMACVPDADVLDDLVEDESGKTETSKLEPSTSPLIEDGSINDNKQMWPAEDTLALLTSIENHYDDMSHVTKRKNVWNVVSTEIGSLNFMHTPNQCKEKWINLLRTFKSVKDTKNRTGRGPPRFIFFDRIDQFLGEKPSMTNTDIINVGSETVNTQDDENKDAQEGSSGRNIPEKSVEKASRGKKRKKGAEASLIEEHLLWKKAEAQKKEEERKKYREEKEKRHNERMEVMREKNELLRRLLRQ